MKILAAVTLSSIILCACSQAEKEPKLTADQRALCAQVAATADADKAPAFCKQP